MKTCTKCQQTKLLKEFNRSKRSKDGVRAICKICQRASSKEYYNKTSDFQKARKKGALSETKMRLLEQEKLAAEGKKLCLVCNHIKLIDDFGKNKQRPDGIDTRCKDCRNSKLRKKYNEDKRYANSIIQKSRNYYKENSDICIKKSIEYKANRAKTDPEYALMKKVKRRVYDIMRQKNWETELKKDEYLGCSYSELKKHIESQFKEGMTWENNTINGWHLDHIIPISMAENIEEAKKLNYYKNLRPIWANENLEKSNKLEIPNRVRTLKFRELLPHELDKQYILDSMASEKEKINARDCEAKIVQTHEERLFLEKTHIQGYLPSSVAVGLYYNEELVSIMSFGKPRFAKNYQWEIIRFSTKLNTIVVGGASKMFKFFIKTYSPHSIITYSDLRFGTGNVYAQIGMVQLESTAPNYFYVKDNIVLTRYKCMKKNLPKILPIYLNKLSEYANMMVNGYEKVLDLGNAKFIWTKE